MIRCTFPSFVTPPDRAAKYAELEAEHNKEHDVQIKLEAEISTLRLRVEQEQRTASALNAELSSLRNQGTAELAGEDLTMQVTLQLDTPPEAEWERQMQLALEAIGDSKKAKSEADGTVEAGVLA
ncbi:MAG: hypothetical protein P4M11_09130 [Candidatus Pacebacteria bacterium]|nr:hypothetical protein [Candidatus Paceibacterota bacterium]